MNGSIRVQRTKQAQTYFLVTVELGGEKFTGFYSVERDMITVKYGFRHQTAQLGGAPYHRNCWRQA